MKLCSKCDRGYPDDSATCPVHGGNLSLAADLPPGMIISNTYRIVRKLGQGSLGAVYLAALTKNKHRRVLQFLNGEISRDDAFTSRFQNAARTLSKLRHKNVVATGVLESAEDGTPFFSMEYVDGPSLRELLNVALCAFDVNLSIAIARCIAEGLGAAHARGMIHLDLKPENILVARKGETLIPKIARFGNGAVREDGETYLTAGRILFTPTYAAPEQWLDTRPADLDARADLYALGGVLFELLTGQTVFDAGDYHGWARLHLNAAPRLPSSLRSDLASWHGLDNLVLTLLAKRREDRPKDAAEVIQLLDAVQHGNQDLETASVHIVDDKAADDRAQNEQSQNDPVQNEPVQDNHVPGNHVQNDRVPDDPAQNQLAPVSPHPVPANTAGLPASLGGSFTGWDTEEEPKSAPELPGPVGNVTSGSEDQTAETHEPPGLLRGALTKRDEEEEPATIPEPRQPSTHLEIHPDESADSKHKPSIAAEAMDFIQSDTIAKVPDAAPIPTFSQLFNSAPRPPVPGPSVPTSIYAKLDSIPPSDRPAAEEPRETEDSSRFLRRPHSGTHSGKVARIAGGSPSFFENPPANEGAEDKPRESNDYRSFFRRDPTIDETANESEKTESASTFLAGAGDAEDETDPQPEPPDFYTRLLADTPLEQQYWVPPGMSSTLDRLESDNSSHYNPAAANDQPVVPGQADADSTGKQQPKRPGGFQSLIGDAGLERSINLNSPEEEDQDKTASQRSGRAAWIVLSAIVVLVVAGIVMWRLGFIDPNQPITKLGKSCDAGDAKSCFDLAAWYEQTSTVKDGDLAAATYYSKACDAAYPQACRKLGFKYLFGNGIPRDNSRAMDLFSKACDQNDNDGCDTLANIYHEGKGIQVDNKKAAQLYGRACSAGDEFGCKWEKKLNAAATQVKPARRPSSQ